MFVWRMHRQQCCYSIGFIGQLFTMSIENVFLSLYMFSSASMLFSVLLVRRRITINRTEDTDTTWSRPDSGYIHHLSLPNRGYIQHLVSPGQRKQTPLSLALGLVRVVLTFCLYIWLTWIFVRVCTVVVSLYQKSCFIWIHHLTAWHVI